MNRGRRACRRGPRLLREQLAGCRHFTGLMNKVCKVGVKYEDVRAQGNRMVALPCKPDPTNDPTPPPKCDKCSLYTAEELEAQEKEINDRTHDIGKAMVAAHNHAGERRNHAGQLPCPVCRSGTLRYRVASNGHMAAQCTTSRCVSWIE